VRCYVATTKVKEIKMNEMKDMDEFAMFVDIATRMTLFAMAKALTPEEIELAFSEINTSLTAQGGYEAEKLMPLTETYKDAVLRINADLV
jgi:hypothetical protein